MISFKESFDYAVKIFMRDWKFYLFASLIIGVMKVVSGSITPGHEAYMHYSPAVLLPWFGLSQIISIIISVYASLMSLNILYAALHADTVRSASDVKAIFNLESYSWKAFATSIIFGVIVAIGTILLIVPGVIVALMYGFATIIILDKNPRISEAFKMSDKLTSGKKMDLLGVGILFVLVNFVVAIVTLGIGTIVTAPVSMIFFAHIYKKLRDGNMGSTTTAMPAAPVTSGDVSGSTTTTTTTIIEQTETTTEINNSNNKPGEGSTTV